MPLYEYECDNNGHRFEVIQKFSDPPIEVCPQCGGPVHKLISSPAFQFKGSGWYVTDYARKDAGGDKANAESTEKGKTEAKDKAPATSSEKDSGTKKTESTSETKSSTEKTNT